MLWFDKIEESNWLVLIAAALVKQDFPHLASACNSIRSVCRVKVVCLLFYLSNLFSIFHVSGQNISSVHSRIFGH